MDRTCRGNNSEICDPRIGKGGSKELRISQEEENEVEETSYKMVNTKVTTQDSNWEKSDDLNMNVYR